MRKVILNKWFLLAFALTITLSSISFAAYRNVRSVCSAATGCPSQNSGTEGGMILDLLSRPFVTSTSAN